MDPPEKCALVQGQHAAGTFCPRRGRAGLTVKEGHLAEIPRRQFPERDLTAFFSQDLHPAGLDTYMHWPGSPWRQMI